MFVSLIPYFTISTIMQLLLILSDYEELNPSPFTPEQGKKILAMLEILPRIDKEQKTFLGELAGLKQKQESVDEKLEVLASTVYRQWRAS